MKGKFIMKAKNNKGKLVSLILATVVFMSLFTVNVFAVDNTLSV